MKRYKSVLAGFLIGILCVNSVAWAEEGVSPSALSEKITETMRELQARHHYFAVNLGYNLSDYICWNSDFNIANCDGVSGGIEAPPFPPGNWYELDLKEAADPAKRATELVDALFTAFRSMPCYQCGSYYGYFVKQSLWDLNGSDRSGSYPGCSAESPENCTCIFYHNFDFPELYDCPYPSTWTEKTVDEDNYLEILDALNDIIKNRLKVLSEVGSEAETAWRSGEGSSYDPVDESPSCVLAKSRTTGCQCPPNGSEFGCGGWSCWSVNSTSWSAYWHEDYLYTMGSGIKEQTKYTYDSYYDEYSYHAGKIAQRFKLYSEDIEDHTGHGDVYIKIHEREDGFTNLDGLKPWDYEWQKVDSTECGSEYTSDKYFADFEPEITTNCPESDDTTKGWQYISSVILVFPEFDVDEDQGVMVEPSENEVIFKTKETYTVYSGSSKDSCNEEKGETVDGFIECPWSIATVGNDTLFARVTLDKSYDPEKFQLRIGGWDGGGILLDKVDRPICIPKDCSTCGLDLAEDLDNDPPDDVYRLKFCLVGGKCEKESISFTVTFWRQSGDCSSQNLVTQKASKTITFEIKENHYNCCAKDDCGNACPIGKDWEEPELEKMGNGDVQVTFPDVNETYIFETPRPGFINGLALESYDSSLNKITIKNPNDSTKEELTSAVALRYGGEIGLVYSVPGTWWTEIIEISQTYPYGEGQLKYIVDSQNHWIESFEYDQGLLKYRKNSSDSNIYTEYFYEDLSNPDHVTKIVQHDHNYGNCDASCDGDCGICRTREVQYDDNGNITEIGSSGSGCSSCSGGDSGRVVEYDDEGRVIATYDRDDNQLYSFDYDSSGDLAIVSLGDHEEMVQEIVRTSEGTSTQVDTLDYSDAYTYIRRSQIQDKTGRVWERISYANTNADSLASSGGFYRTLYRYAPIRMSDPDLQAYWTFDEDEGGWAIDGSGFNRAGVFVSGATTPDPWATSGVITLDDTYDEHLVVQGYKGVTGHQSRTICFWVDSSAEGPVVSWGDDANQNWVVSVDVSGYPKVAATGNTGSGSAYTSTSVNSGRHHVAIVLADDGSPTVEEIKIYVDGDEKTTTQSNGTFTINTSDNSDVLIGSDGTDYYSGQLDNLIILDRALSDTEIDVLYNTQKSSPDDIEVRITIPPKGDPDGNGIRRESITTYDTVVNGGRYIKMQREISYDPTQSIAAHRVQYLNTTVYDPINNGEGTRIIESWTNRDLDYVLPCQKTLYLYDSSYPNSTQVQDELQPELLQGIAKATGPSSSMQETYRLARHYVYDSQGRIKDEYQYNYYVTQGPLDLQTDDYLVGSHYEYDGLGDLTQQYTTDGEHPTVHVQITDYRYNGFKELYMTKSPTGVVTGKIYDDAGRTRSEFTFADPGDWDDITSYGELLDECSDSTISSRPSISSLTYYTYDEDTGRLESVQRVKNDGDFSYSTPAEAATTGITWVKTEYTYDAYGRRETVTQDADGSHVTPLETKSVYDNQGQAYMTILPNNKYTKTIQDGRGQVKEQIVGYLTNRNDLESAVPISVTQFIYDAAGNLKEQIYPDGSRVQNVYDGYDRLKRVYKGVVPKN